MNRITMMKQWVIIIKQHLGLKTSIGFTGTVLPRPTCENFGMHQLKVLCNTKNN